MPDGKVWTPQKAAIHLTKICDQISQSLGLDRFPVDVSELALGAFEVFKYPDPIVKVEAVDIKTSMVHCLPTKLKPLDAAIQQRPEISRPYSFTQAHELGHYILHRLKRDEFQCSSDDMLSWEDKNIEAEADLFASFLLMPLNDFRSQLTPDTDIEVLRHCADRYGVSLTAAALKWIECTEDSAVLILSRDGFMKWAFSSSAARRNGAFPNTPEPHTNPCGLVSSLLNDYKNERGLSFLPHSGSHMLIAVLAFVK